MDDTLTRKLDSIESLLLQLHQKIDNFLGFEALNAEEKKNLEEIKQSIDVDGIDAFKEVFED